MIVRILLTASASADSASILVYLNAKAGEQVALKYRGMFQSIYKQLAVHPHSGSLRRGLGTNIRIAIAAPYVVIYRHSGRDDSVIILRVVHGRRKITGKLLQTDI